MKKMLFFQIVLLFLAGIAYGGPTAGEILQKADTFRGFGENGFSFDLMIISHRPHKKPSKNRLIVNVKSQKSLVKFLAPKRVKGRAMLFEGRNLWLKIPRTRKVIRISPAQRLMGEASNGDVAATNFSLDYKPVLVGEEEVEGALCFHLTLTAVDRRGPYHKIEYWVIKETGKPFKSMHYSVSEKLLKVVYYKSFEKLNGQEKISRLLLINPLVKGNYTWMIYKNYQREDLGEHLFRKENLNRL